MPVILATQEAEVRRISVWGQPRQVVWETLSQKKKKNHEKGLVEWLHACLASTGPQVQTPVPPKKKKFDSCKGLAVGEVDWLQKAMRGFGDDKIIP
jgi:hypothetical protein